MGKAIGIGGIFMKFKDPSRMNKWYQEVLGLEPNDYGVLFSFNGNSYEKAYLQLGTFDQSSGYFGSPHQQYMINFRVDDLGSLLKKLKQLDVEVIDEIEEFSYGKFLHINDPEGNRIELWEPLGESFEQENCNEMK